MKINSVRSLWRVTWRIPLCRLQRCFWTIRCTLPEVLCCFQQTIYWLFSSFAHKHFLRQQWFWVSFIASAQNPGGSNDLSKIISLYCYGQLYWKAWKICGLRWKPKLWFAYKSVYFLAQAAYCLCSANSGAETSVANFVRLLLLEIVSSSCSCQKALTFRGAETPRCLRYGTPKVLVWLKGDALVSCPSAPSPGERRERNVRGWCWPLDLEYHGPLSLGIVQLWLLHDLWLSS